jgi:glycosyltransferase involved in cell wall biosynthesis
MTSPHKILQVLGRSTGGIAAHVADLTEGLQDQHDIQIDIAAPPDLPVEMPKQVLPLVIPSGTAGHRRAVATLRQIILSGRYEVVHSHGLRAAIDSARAARTTPATTVATIHNLVLPEISGRLRSAFYRQAEPVAVRWNDLVFAPSADIARRLQAAAPQHGSKVEVLHLGVPSPSPPPRNREEVRAGLGVLPGQELLVTVARLAPQKALDVLLRVMMLLPDHIHLAVVGSGPLEARLKRFAQASGLADRVTFLGHRPAPQDEVAAADLFCLTSVWEACSLAAQEAIWLGVPVVSTAVGGMPELIEDRVSGRLVPAGDARAFARAVQELLALPEERGTLASNALLHLREHFSRSAMLQRLAGAYRGDHRAIS